ncbi:MAG TPA: peptidoglycan editing factor PgeF [Armatimonadota bacterium]
MALELSFGCAVQEKAGVSLLQWASWLREGVPHGITTRDGGVSRAPYNSLNLGDNVGDVPGAVIANRAKLGAALGDMSRPRVFPKQVHGATVVTVRDLPGRGDPPPEADALITDRTDIFIAVTVADCVPVLFLDPVRRAVGVAHGGWRGLAAGVLRNTVEAMRREYGTDPATLQAAIGPHIGVCCYEVGADVAAGFASIPRAIREDKEGRRYLNLARVARADLSSAGLDPEYVSISAPCTSCFVDAYFSLRAEGVTGRFAAIVGLADRENE